MKKLLHEISTNKNYNEEKKCIMCGEPSVYEMRHIIDKYNMDGECFDSFDDPENESYYICAHCDNI